MGYVALAALSSAGVVISVASVIDNDVAKCNEEVADDLGLAKLLAQVEIP